MFNCNSVCRALPLGLALGSLALFSACGEDGDTIEPAPRWNLTFSDEFDGEAGALPDQQKWVFDVGTGWGNQQLEFDTDRPENASLDGEGNLVITARREDFRGSQYTSARIKTQGWFDQKYGRFEARIKLPPGQGMWPAFWMLGSSIDEVSWPRCGEIDIMEFRGQEPNIIHGSLHGPGYSAGQAITAKLTADETDFTEDFHIYAVDWDPGRITWWVDDEVYHVQNVGGVSGNGPWVYDQNFFIILNLAVGGTFVGPPNASTPFPGEMVVDYVRVFERVR